MKEYIYNIIWNGHAFDAKFWAKDEDEALAELSECFKTGDMLRHIIKAY